MSDERATQNEPYVIKEEPGRRAWCSCGRSGTQPYCDGSHKGTEHTPVVVDIEDERTVAWCGCRRTGTRPYCDGSHAR